MTPVRKAAYAAAAIFIRPNDDSQSEFPAIRARGGSGAWRDDHRHPNQSGDGRAIADCHAMPVLKSQPDPRNLEGQYTYMSGSFFAPSLARLP